MRRLVLLAILLAFWGCSDPVPVDDAESNAARPQTLTLAGRLEDKRLDEASGLAFSVLSDDLLWSVNDDGPAVLYALGLDGTHRGRVKIDKAGHRDWEDLESFTVDGTGYLLVGDIGDNEAKRKDVSLYLVEEPEPGEDEIDIRRRIDFSYPDGPRDAEAIAVDVEDRRIYVISKRDIPPRLYALPLDGDERDSVTAEYLGLMDSLPQPNRADVNAAPLTDNYHWQPTSMAIAPDGGAALILTYGAVYYYAREAGQSWPDAFRQPPLRLVLRRLHGAESITFDRSGRHAYITTEGRNAPLLYINLEVLR